MRVSDYARAATGVLRVPYCVAANQSKIKNIITNTVYRTGTRTAIYGSLNVLQGNSLRHDIL